MKFLKIFLIFAFSMNLAPALSQPKVLMDACNAIEDKERRVNCFSELVRIQGGTLKASEPSSQTLAIKKARDSFFSVSSAVENGVSFNTYTNIILEPAKALGVMKSDAPQLDTIVFENLQSAVVAYNDAARVWHASIYKSQDGGAFVGRILNPELTGLMPIVQRYGLETRSVLLNTHLPPEAAITKIWRFADQMIKDAFRIAESSSTQKQAPTAEPQDAPVTIVRTPTSPEEESKVEQIARENGCNTHPVAARTKAVGDVSEYAVYCSNGRTQTYQCSTGTCTLR